MACGECNPCANQCNNQCCIAACLQWGLDDCYLRARCPDGTELPPLDLCAWLKQHETCTEFLLVPENGTGGYIQFTNECGEVEKIYICDYLGLGDIECLRNVWNDKAQPCDLMVFDPSCGNPCDPRYNKWSHYRVPRYEQSKCISEPDDEGYHRVLTLNDCGCIQECKIFVTGKCWEWSLRDSWPDDPDWPFSMGSRLGDNTEIIDLELDKRCPMFGKTDLKVTFQYAFGIQNTNPASPNHGDYNFKSMVFPLSEPKHEPSATDLYQKTITVQGVNDLPYGSHEWQVSRTVIVPRGQKLYLTHKVEMYNINAQLESTFYGESSTPSRDSYRLHALHVFVETCKGEKK